MKTANKNANLWVGDREEGAEVQGAVREAESRLRRKIITGWKKLLGEGGSSSYLIKSRLYSQNEERLEGIVLV